MKPTTLGELPGPNDPQPAPGEKIKIDENETRLLYQEFLMKPETRVLDFLNENFAKVNDFVRFECGEPTEKDDA
jgi:translation elongation factor EF-Ts